jgi:hypothetical protein
MKITKTILKKIILEEMETMTNIDEGDDAMDAQGLAAVKDVIGFLQTKVFALPQVKSKIEQIKRNPTALAQLQANLNQMLGVGEAEVAGLATKTRQQQKQFTKGQE